LERTLAAALLAAVTVGLSPLLAGGVNGLSAMVFSALEAGQGVARYNESLIGTISPFLPGRLPTLLGFSLWALALAAFSSALAQPPELWPAATWMLPHLPSAGSALHGVQQWLLRRAVGVLHLP